MKERDLVKFTPINVRLMIHRWKLIFFFLFLMADREIPISSTGLLLCRAQDPKFVGEIFLSLIIFFFKKRQIKRMRIIRRRRVYSCLSGACTNCAEIAAIKQKRFQERNKRHTHKKEKRERERSGSSYLILTHLIYFFCLFYHAI